METYQHPMVANAIKAIETTEVQEMVKKLSEYGLGVFMPHLHTEKGFEPLPNDTVQLEQDLAVSFVKRDNPIAKGAAPVGWSWNKEKAEVVAVCLCGGADCAPHWNRPK